MIRACRLPARRMAMRGVSAGVLPSGPPVLGLRPRRQHVKYHRPDHVGEDGNCKGRRPSCVDGTGGKVSWKKRRGDDRWWGYRKTRPDTVRGRGTCAGGPPADRQGVRPRVGGRTYGEDELVPAHSGTGAQRIAKGPGRTAGCADRGWEGGRRRLRQDDIRTGVDPAAGDRCAATDRTGFETDIRAS